MGRILTAVMMFFFIAGAADKALLKGRLGLAAEFDKGFNSTGSLTMAMAGIMCIAPVAGKSTPRSRPCFPKSGRTRLCCPESCFRSIWEAIRWPWL